MAQKYNPSTGQWEEEEEGEGSLTSGTAAAFGAGSAPAVDGSAMTAGIPQFSNGAFSNPQYNLNSLPEGYGWGDEDYLTSQGITKKYANPWDTKYSYMKGEQDLGFGYDDYQTAISKLAFNSGKLQIPELAATEGLNEYGMPAAGSPGAPGGWTHNAYYTPANSGYGVDGYFSSPEQRGPTFATEQELFDYMLKDSSRGLPLTMESREKYGRPLLSGQLQNTYAMLANPNGVSGFTEVPDWNYHRTPYAGGSYSLSGDAAMVGTDPFFGPDGKVLGYRFNNPDHYNLVDNSGRVTSAGVGSTSLSPEVQNLLRGIDDKSAFINASDSSKFGYGSSSVASYNKADSSFESFLKTAAPIALAYFAMPELGALFNGAESLGGAELLGELGGYGFTSAEVAGALPELLGGGSLVEAGLGGLGLEGASGLISDLGSLFSPSNINGLELSNFGDFINGLDPSAFTGSNFTPSLGDVTTSTFADTGASSLSNLAPEIMGPQEPFYFDDWGKGTNALGEMTNGKGFRALQDIGANTLRDLGVPRETAANLSQGAGKMYNFMTQPMGGQRPGLFQAPSPLNTLFRGVGALDSMKQNREAMDYLKKARAGIDGNANNPNRPRGDFANQQWMNGISDPMAGYQDFMMGGGRQFIDQARAQAAKGGKRGSYINSGKMNSDLASLYMKNQIDRQNMIKGGFEGNVDNTNARAAYDSAMLPMITNQNAPLFQMLGNTGMQYGLSELFSGR